MKVNIISGGEEIFRATAFGLPDRDAYESSFRRLEEYTRGLSDRARDIYETAKDNFMELYDSNVRERLRKLSSSKRGIYRDNVVQYLGTQEDIAMSPMQMRRWVLSNPRMASLFKSQSTHGWGAKHDAFNLPGDGEVDVYWKAIRNGVATENEKGEWWTEYEYGACDVAGEEPLTTAAQSDLVATMVIIDALIDDGIDPLSPLGEKL